MIVWQGGWVCLYFNGEFINVFSILECINVNNDGDFIIGDSDCKNVMEFFFNGLIDELWVYNCVLNELEVCELYDVLDCIEWDVNIVNFFLGDDFNVELSKICGMVFSWLFMDGVFDLFVVEFVIMLIEVGEFSYEVIIFDMVIFCIVCDCIVFNVIDLDDLDCNIIFLLMVFMFNNDGLNDIYGISNFYVILELLIFEIYDCWGNCIFVI